MNPSWTHLGRWFQTWLYHYIPVGVDSGLRRNDDWGGNGIVAIPTALLLFLPNS